MRVRGRSRQLTSQERRELDERIKARQKARKERKAQKALEESKNDNS